MMQQKQNITRTDKGKKARKEKASDEERARKDPKLFVSAFDLQADSQHHTV